MGRCTRSMAIRTAVTACVVAVLLVAGGAISPARVQDMGALALQWGFRIYNLPPSTGREIMTVPAAPATSYPALMVPDVVTNGFDNGATGKYLHHSEDLPYRVPDGYELGLIYARLDTKYGQVGTASLLAILNAASVLDHANELRPADPIWYPAGSELRAILINNDAGAQVMVFVMQGVLVPAHSDYRLLKAP